MDETPAWLAADWGTSRLRVWALAADGRVRARRVAEAGMGRLAAPADFTAVFRDLTADWRGAGTLPVVVCGMAGAREGWREAAYARAGAPLAELADAAVAVPAAGADLDVRILPGLRQDDPPDVMRGEETKLAGLAAAGHGDGVVLLAGTHDKWVDLAGGRVRRFFTSMTGDAFAALAEHSVLKHTLTGDGFDDAAFADAVAAARAAPAALVRRAFGLRATALLQGLDPAVARARLSGWLVGAEIADALAVLDAPRAVTLVGSEAQIARYRVALGAFDAAVDAVDADAVTLAGLRAAHARLFGASP